MDNKRITLNSLEPRYAEFCKDFETLKRIAIGWDTLQTIGYEPKHNAPMLREDVVNVKSS